MSNNLPCFSIIMPSLNQASYLPAAMDSVLGQSVADLELIVADGASTDGTLDILHDYAARDKRVRWFSRQDKGPADALNQALGETQGKIIGWLNSDDLYEPGALSRVLALWEADQDLVMIYGHGRHVDASGVYLEDYPTRGAMTPIDAFAQGCFICQPTVFFRRELYERLGGLDESLKTAFDFEYWVRAFSHFPGRIGFVDAYQACTRLHDACITLRMRRTVAIEGAEVVHRYLGVSPFRWWRNFFYEYLQQEEGDSPNQKRDHLLETLRDMQSWLVESDVRQGLALLATHPLLQATDRGNVYRVLNIVRYWLIKKGVWPFRRWLPPLHPTGE